MVAQTGSRRRRIRAASMVVLGAIACDLGVEPPSDVPLLAVSAREVRLFVVKGSEEDDEVAVQISNNGGGTLVGLDVEGPVYVGAASGWLIPTLQDSTLTLTAQAVTLDGDTLETGSYEASVGVVADAAGNSPRTITVNLQVGKSQQMALSVAEVTFAVQATDLPPPLQTVTISNAGDGVLSELAVDSIVCRPPVDPCWLEAVIPFPNAPTVVELQPYSVPSEGTHHATVFVGSRIADPSSDSIRVEYIVAPPPTLVLSARTLELETTAGETTPIVRQIALREVNHRPLSGLTDSVPPAVPPDRDWLTSARNKDDAPATLTVTVDPTDLTGDSLYRDTVFVSSSAGDIEQVEVSLRVRGAPMLHLSMDSVQFTMNPTDLPPGAQLVRIENSGDGTLSCPVTDPQPAAWLSASVIGTTAPCDLVLTISGPIAPGTDSGAVVTVTEPGGGTADLKVNFKMLPGPSIVLSSDSVTFRSDVSEQDTLLPPPLTLAVANGGTGILTALKDTVVYPVGTPPWLGTAVLANDTAATTLELRPDTVPAAGVYGATVVIRSGLAGVDSVRLPVVLEVEQATAPEPTIGLSSDSVLFRYVKTEDAPWVVLGLENLSSVGFEDLSVAGKPRWLTYSFEGGNDPPTALRLTVNTARLDDSPPNDTVRISADRIGNNPIPETVELPVVLEVAGPEMVATSERVVFRAYEGQTPLPVAQTITVSNRGSGTLQGIDVSSGPGWLDVDRSSPAAPTVISMTPTTSDPTPPLDSRFRVYGQEADPLWIDVRFEIDDGPTLKLATDSVRLSAAAESTGPDSVTVDLYNAGKGDLGIASVAWSQPWLTAVIDSSVAPARLVLVAAAGALTSDTYTDNVRVVSDPGGTADLAVAFTVAPTPEIQVSPRALVFHADALSEAVPDSQTITVFDPAGGPSGQVVATSEATWLSVEVVDTAPPVTIVVRPTEVLDSRFSPYVDSVLVGSTVGAGELQPVHVTYNIDVGRDPIIYLSDNTLEFRKPTSAQDAVPAQTVQVINGGSRTLRELSVDDVTAGGPVDWLFVLLDSRIAPATLTVAIKPAEAAATVRPVATLRITGENAEARDLTVLLLGPP